MTLVPCRLARTAGKNVPNFSTAGCQEVTADKHAFWDRFTDCIKLSRSTAESKRCFKYEVTTDAVSVGVLMFRPSCEPSAQQPAAPAKTRKRKRQQQDATEWVRGLPNRCMGQTDRIMGPDPGRRSLSTAAIHSQAAADSLSEGQYTEADRRAQYKILSWSSSRWREASGIKFRLHKTKLWLNREPGLESTLQQTPSAEVASSADFGRHIVYRVQHAAAVRKHFGDQRHRQLRWSTFIKRQKAYAAICKDITGGNSNTVVAYGDANFSSSCLKGNPSTPTVSLRRALGRQCRVYDTDEFRTSRLCCACKTAMNGMNLPLTGNDLPVAALQGFCFPCTLHA